MSEPKMYTWRDADAPILTGEPGALIQVLRKCLVEGFGSGQQESTPPGAGWEMQVDDPPNRAAFRSLNPLAGGQWFYFDDTGDHEATGNDGEGAAVAAMYGAGIFNGWDGNGDPDIDETFGKNGPINAQWVSKSEDPTATARAWILIADDRTAYFVASARLPTSQAWNIDEDFINQREGRLAAFGDYAKDNLSGVYGGSGIVIGNNTSVSTTQVGAFMGHFFKAAPATYDSIASGIDGVVLLREVGPPSVEGGSAPLMTNSTYNDPIPYRRHTVGEPSLALDKGILRGCYVPMLGSSITQSVHQQWWPDPKKVYGEGEFSSALGETFYLFQAYNASGGVPILFSTQEWE